MLVNILQFIKNWVKLSSKLNKIRLNNHKNYYKV